MGRPERVLIGGTFVDQFVLFSKEAVMTGTDNNPDPDPGEVPEATGFISPGAPLPTAEQIEQIFKVLDITFERLGPDPEDEGAHLAGALHALTGMWAVYASHSPHLDDFNHGFSDAYDGNVSEVLAALAFTMMRTADAARAMKPLADALLVPMTLAAACGDVACWAFVAAGEIAGSDADGEKIHAACRAMTDRLRVLYDQAAMVNEMLVLHGQVHRETGGC
jgi:hypothetical protein